MLALNHTLFGTFIAVSVKDPALVAPLAISSHFALDVLPHFGNSESFGTYSKKFYRVIIADGLASISTGLIAVSIWPEQFWIIALGILCSVGPDFFWTLAPKAKKGSWAWKFFRFHKRIQLSETKPGIFFEIIWAAVFSFGLYYLFQAQ